MSSSGPFLQQIFERLNEHLKQSQTRMDTLTLLGHIVRRQVRDRLLVVFVFFIATKVLARLIDATAKNQNLLLVYMIITLMWSPSHYP